MSREVYKKFEICIEFIDYVINSNLNIYSAYYSDDRNAIATFNSSFLENIEMIHQLLLENMNFHNIDLNQLPIILNVLIDAIEKKDNIYIVDLLEYEITPLLLEWKEKLNIILEK